MLRMLLPVLLLVAGIAGGVVAGMFLGGDGDAAHGPDAATGETAAADAAPEAPDPDAGPVGPGSTEAFEYVRLNNQFVVPIVRDGVVRSLIVISLTIEVDAGQAAQVFNREPRLRDAFLRVMFSHANAGGFDGSFTSPVALNPLRAGLRDAAFDTLGAIVNDVLIVDIVRQDA